MLAADRGPGRRLFTLVYEWAARGYAAYVRRDETQAAAYVRGTLASEEALHGLADIDVAVVVAPDPTGAARARVRRRFARAGRFLPAITNLVYDYPMVFDEPGLEEVATQSALTYGLNDGGAIYSGASSDVDKIGLLERPELYGPRRKWRLLDGPDRRPAEAVPDEATRRVTSWLELQTWWLWAFGACVQPDRPKNAYLCVKLIAEAARIWLWLTDGECVADRVTALARGRVAMDTEADAFESAAQLHRMLRRMPAAPLTDFLPPFVRLSSQLARELARQVVPAGTTEVRLRLPVDGELALPHGGPPAGNVAALKGADPRLLPLLDWRALVLPAEPDETFVLAPGDPGDPVVLAAAATAIDCGPHLTLSAERLILHPMRPSGRGRLRTVQCEVTDPVSFALARGALVANFPNVPGFSIQDTARRALAEHAAWLGASMGDRGGTVPGRLITSARAGLLWQSVAEGEPELPLTVDATLQLLGERAHGAAAAAAREAYHDFARTRRPPPERVVTALRELVLALPAYTGQVRMPEAA